jgi:uncharacterized membrane protein
MKIVAGPGQRVGDNRSSVIRRFGLDGQALPFLTLAAATVMCVALVASRFLYTGSRGYFFLIWNLFLAWVPFLLALLVRRAQGDSHRPRFRLLILGALWLLFYPNAPYILTDFLHLQPRSGSPVWFDMMLIASFAWTGLLLGFASLYLMQQLVERFYGRARGWMFVVIVSFLSSFGIYLGRFERWNSWDIVSDPRGLMRGIWSMMIDPTGHPRTIAVTIVLALFLLIGYFTLSAIVHLQRGSRRG